MATAPTTLPPPPSAMGGDTAAPPPDASTAPGAGAPAPPTPAPGMQQATQVLIGVVGALRAIAKAYPQVSPHVVEANDAIRKIGLGIMQSQPAGEPMAPPTAG